MKSLIILVSRVEAPVVALVSEFAAARASAGCTAAWYRGGRVYRRFVEQVYVEYLCVREAVAVAVAAEFHEECSRRQRRVGAFLPLGWGWRGRVGSVDRRPWLVGWRVGHVDRVRRRVDLVRDRGSDGWQGTYGRLPLQSRSCVPDAFQQDFVFAFQVVHLVVEHGDVPAKQGDLAAVLAGRPCVGCELVAAERTLPFPELVEAVPAGEVAALHDRGICVGEWFQADATLQRRGTEGCEYQAADVGVDGGHFVDAWRRTFPVPE